jgi:hypothetical protein
MLRKLLSQVATGLGLLTWGGWAPPADAGVATAASPATEELGRSHQDSASA